MGECLVSSGAMTAVAAVLLTALVSIYFLLYFNATKTTPVSEKSAYLDRFLPNACRAYIINKGTTLDLSKGRYIHVPGREPSYDHTCFIMKPRYNCATNKTTQPKAYEWKLVLQSDPNDAETLCDVGKVVDDLGGPGAVLLQNKHVGLFGNSRLRQIFEALACKYQNQLTKVILHRGKQLSEGALARDSPIAIEDFGTSLPLPVDKGPLPTCHGSAKSHGPFYRVPLSNDTVFLPNCDDNLALMEYGGSFRTYFSFWPHLLDDPLHVFDKFLGLSNMSSLDYIAFSQYGDILKTRVPETLASWDDFDNLSYHLLRAQVRDIGWWFGADNPWITRVPDTHGCMDGPPTDEAAVFLFCVMFDVHALNFSTENSPSRWLLILSSSCLVVVVILFLRRRAIH